MPSRQGEKLRNGELRPKGNTAGLRYALTLHDVRFPAADPTKPHTSQRHMGGSAPVHTAKVNVSTLRAMHGSLLHRRTL